MESLPEIDVRSQIDRICDSDAFRAAPKLARLLRVLAGETLHGGGAPLGQRFVAEHVMAGADRSGPKASVAVRMQVGRLRRQLQGYYATAGIDDPIRVEVPKRNYRLRFVPAGPAARSAAPRAVERSTLAVVEFIDLRGGDRAWLPSALTRDVIVALAPFHGVAIRGPLPPAVLGRPASAAADFLLVGDVRAHQATAHLSLRLLAVDSGLQCWAKSVDVPLNEEGMRADASAILAAVADELADETGVIACAGMRAAAAKPLESLSAHEVVLAFWRFLMTGSFDDLTTAREAAAASAGVPESAATLTASAMTRLAVYLSDPRPQARCPREPLELMERAVSLAPGDPWVQVHRGFALWITREPIGLEAICRTLDDGRPGSGSFRGMVGSLMSVTGIGLDRGEALLEEAMVRAPQPLYWYCHHLALCGFRRGDLAVMRAALGRIAVRTDPFSLVLRMVLAACEGDLATARGLSRAVLDVFPAFPDAGEAMMRRLLHDDHVDAIAAALEPLGLGWFE